MCLARFAQKSLQNERGVALILVLSAIVMLTMLIVEFAFDNQAEYRMAKYQLERLQSYYLAQSADHLVKLELKMNQMAASTIANSGFADQVQIDLSIPLCQQFPMSSSIFRAALHGDLSGAPKEENAPQENAAQGLLSGLPLQGGEEFLSFKGDFDGECVDESSKINLNAFATLNPEKQTTGIGPGADNPYDAYKKIIVAMLSQEQFKPLFEESMGSHNVKIEEIARNIADWVDLNDTINDYNGVAVGSETAEYGDGGEPKNGKLSTPGDIFKIPGVEDKWWTAVSDYFTIYGDGKINVCRSSDELVTALILRYTATRQDLPPIQQKDQELLKALVKSVRTGCQGVQPNPTQIEAALNAKLGELLGATAPPGGATPAASKGGVFADWITGQSRYYALKISGQVGDTVVKITEVVDLGEGTGADASKWKILYWRVD